MNSGGDNFSIGENNPNTKLTDEDVLMIRKRVHLGKEYPKDVYKDFEDRISYSRFWSLLHGTTWKNVDTSMIKPIKIDNNGYCAIKTNCGFKKAHRLVMLTWKPIPDAENFLEKFALGTL